MSFWVKLRILVSSAQLSLRIKDTGDGRELRILQGAALPTSTVQDALRVMRGRILGKADGSFPISQILGNPQMAPAWLWQR